MHSSAQTGIRLTIAGAVLTNVVANLIEVETAWMSRVEQHVHQLIERRLVRPATDPTSPPARAWVLTDMITIMEICLGVDACTR